MSFVHLEGGPLPQAAEDEQWRCVVPKKKGVPRILREFVDTYGDRTGSRPGDSSVHNYVAWPGRLVCSALPLQCNRGRGFIAGARYEHTTYQIFMSGSAWPTIDKS